MLTAVLAVLGAIASVVGIVAYLDARTSKRIKRLVWETIGSVPLAAASQTETETDYTLSILYERPSTQPEIITSADVTYVRFANLGKEPIRGNDIAPANPLRLEIEQNTDGRGRPLDVSLAASSREVIRLNVGALERGEPSSTVSIQFDFLDHQDGGLFRVLSSGPPVAVCVKGDIVGMPQGPEEWNPYGKEPKEVRGWEAVLWVIPQLLALAGLGLLFREVTGSWTGVWLLLLPPIVFVVVVLLCILVAEGPTAYKVRRLGFPKSLEIPAHFGFSMMMGPGGERLIRRGTSVASDHDPETAPRPESS